ncbi:MAG: sensor domain-containing diguanylate cyclase [Deltaproteobacteria bacterium]|nr:sensor domain-containing diguanylate cyclase [Deltaproteobacteria bacterium]
MDDEERIRGHQGGSLRPFIEVTRRLLSLHTLEDALSEVCTTALEILPAEHVSVRILDASGTRLLSSARGGEGAQHQPVRFQSGRGVAGWVVAQGESVRIDDATEDPRFVPMTSSEQGFDPRSILGAPLWASDRPVGVLGVTSSDVAAFEERDELVLTLLANCASPSIERVRLERLTITDPLTLAFNQRYLVPRLREELARAGRRGRPVSVVLMDLDHFKAANDDHGHAAGDRVLQVFVERIRELVRVSDVVVRRGGEEFVLILPEMSGEKALGVAERIRERMARDPVVVDGTTSVHQTVSLGVASWDSEASAEELEARADAAMYKAKRAGRDRVVLAED